MQKRSDVRLVALTTITHKKEGKGSVHDIQVKTTEETRSEVTTTEQKQQPIC